MFAVSKKEYVKPTVVATINRNEFPSFMKIMFSVIYNDLFS